ncbi:hypothetical protein OG311_37735 (plasmid) [Streptomyces sp. NBC_01343]|uniref:hypothetical protein n=1 Tax=Streptomyces sp. NBC_01343 TaxID=2903832 RepID=UPI002E11981F|nr:hypothetical protein OG311_37735 [Streptomyces sp. NBC_01343]
MTAFMEAAGHVPAALSALHALGALLRLWQHRRAGKSGPCGCAVPAVREDPGHSEKGELLLQASLVRSPGSVVMVTVEGLPAGAVAVVTVTAGPEAVGRGRW